MQLEKDVRELERKWETLKVETEKKDEQYLTNKLSSQQKHEDSRKEMFQTQAHLLDKNYEQQQKKREEQRKLRRDDKYATTSFSRKEIENQIADNDRRIRDIQQRKKTESSL